MHGLEFHLQRSLFIASASELYFRLICFPIWLNKYNCTELIIKWFQTDLCSFICEFAICSQIRANVIDWLKSWPKKENEHGHTFFHCYAKSFIDRQLSWLNTGFEWEWGKAILSSDSADFLFQSISFFPVFLPSYRSFSLKMGWIIVEPLLMLFHASLFA